MFNHTPTRTMSWIFTFPELKMMAFGGVATGSINAQEEARTAPTIKLTGEIAREAASDIKIGMTMLAVAVLEVISVKKLIPAITRIIIIHTGIPFKYRN